MSRLIDSILIPTDGSDGALAGATRGVALASRTEADVHVLSVVESRLPAVDLEEFESAPLTEEAEEAVEEIARLAGEYDEDLEVTTRVREGTPFQLIREYANRRDIDVIAMGTKGRTGLDRVLLGSVAENVLRTARTPVLAVPPKAGELDAADVAFDRFLLPTDGSDGAAIATEWGIALASRLESSVHTLYSIDTDSFADLEEFDDLLEVLEERGEEAIDAVREYGADAGVSVSGAIAKGSPVSEIPGYATENAVDLIVMGTHGRTGIGQWFLGSVTENVVRQAEVPVFCVPVSADSP
ncbi:Nucleotide-binding universal stress protein, UspA family [Halobiforma haloterrestris]|uniref:Nucleotide-binding universal stress protein, UspA family n=1 Tax=Natronobacterium haloterrestre TaxID=148448 RepID=A0A1I1DMP4_NATHA|nr:universal stress protein [Halobiforma haloterrestris]SFB76107.1 Nucleotide-binding universal stress protein, UspA family [Halobiforma haloterrestris]